MSSTFWHLHCCRGRQTRLLFKSISPCSGWFHTSAHLIDLVGPSIWMSSHDLTHTHKQPPHHTTGVMSPSEIGRTNKNKMCSHRGQSSLISGVQTLAAHTHTQTHILKSTLTCTHPWGECDSGWLFYESPFQWTLPPVVCHHHNKQWPPSKKGAMVYIFISVASERESRGVRGKERLTAEIKCLWLDCGTDKYCGGFIPEQD